MKFIHNYQNWSESISHEKGSVETIRSIKPLKFLEEEIEDIRNVYFDIVDDLDLNHNDFKTSYPDDSSFHVSIPHDKIEIHIKIIRSEYHMKGKQLVIKEPTEEQMIKVEQVRDKIIPHIERIRSMGYRVKYGDMFGFFNVSKATNGIIITIEK